MKGNARVGPKTQVYAVGIGYVGVGKRAVKAARKLLRKRLRNG